MCVCVGGGATLEVMSGEAKADPGAISMIFGVAGRPALFGLLNCMLGITDMRAERTCRPELRLVLDHLS